MEKIAEPIAGAFFIQYKTLRSLSNSWINEIWSHLKFSSLRNHDKKMGLLLITSNIFPQIVKFFHEFGRLLTISWFFRNKRDRNRNEWLGMLVDRWVISNCLLQKAGKGGDKGGKGNANKGGGAAGGKSGAGGAGGGKKGLPLFKHFRICEWIFNSNLSLTDVSSIFRWQKVIHRTFCMGMILLTCCMSLAVAVFIFLYKIFKRVFHLLLFFQTKINKIVYDANCMRCINQLWNIYRNKWTKTIECISLSCRWALRDAVK